MSLSIITGTFDNDVKGGQSTGFFLSIKPDAKSKLPPVYLHYRLFDLMDGWFHPHDVCVKYIAEQKEIDKLVVPIKIDKTIPSLTDVNIVRKCLEIIKANPSVVIDYKKGNTKALNVLVGQVMKSFKNTAPESVKKFFEIELRD